MLDLAHITDLHLVEHNHARRRGMERHRLRYLSAGRPIDATARVEKALDALRIAQRHAKHIVVTGDLTEDGTPEQFELLAEVLDRAGVDPERITIIGGNHDGYADPAGFDRALIGPLRRYAKHASATQPLDLGDAWLMPVRTTVVQSWLRSHGSVPAADLERMQRLGSEARRRQKLALVVQHHPPQGYKSALWNWIDGLLNARAATSLLRAHPRLQVLHGHTHKRESVQFRTGQPAQSHSGAAVVSSARNVRFYRISPEALHPVIGPTDASVRVGNVGRALLPALRAQRLPSLP